MKLTDDLKNLFIETAQTLKGSDCRIFKAQVVKLLGKGGQRRAELDLSWNRGTIRKGTHELECGIRCYDNFSGRGRKSIEEHLPNLLDDIQAIVEDQSQTDPTFQTTRLYTRLTSAEVRRQLIEQKGYTDNELPTEEVIRQKLHKLDYRLRAVQKSRPQKKIPETDAIFNQLDEIHDNAKKDETVLRLSIDAKATVLVGPYSRGGRSRVTVKAVDHDFDSDEKLTPFGILLPDLNELHITLTPSHVTSDFIVDCLQDFWGTANQRFPEVSTLLINLDNGPENSSRRTQFMKRLTQFADEFQIRVQLAYYPPYHSKYNPIERRWGALEQHWNGSLLDTVDTVVKFAQTMKWKGSNPVVKLVQKTYQRGVRLTKKAMDQLEKRFKRMEGLEKWFVKISPLPIEIME